MTTPQERPAPQDLRSILFPVATKQGGGSEASPNVCLKPPPPPGPPMPKLYPSKAELEQAKLSTCCDKVKVLNQPVLTKGSEIPTSSGDKEGKLGGVISGTNGGEVKFKRGSSKVLAGGKAIAFHTCVTGHNGSNANNPAGVHSSPSQKKVYVKP